MWWVSWDLWVESVKEWSGLKSNRQTDKNPEGPTEGRQRGVRKNGQLNLVGPLVWSTVCRSAQWENGKKNILIDLKGLHHSVRISIHQVLPSGDSGSNSNLRVKIKIYISLELLSKGSFLLVSVDFPLHRLLSIFHPLTPPQSSWKGTEGKGWESERPRDRSPLCHLLLG